ncbi:MAG: undecaprenyl-diphosphate phosphatase [Elusimicrobia bacterium]|nr:undecaprenyl-diphosphate phosphatase [Elusimicrobiota bacterium]
MTVAQAVILGTIQGLAEFLPISSSAHLVLAPRLFGWADQGLAYDVALHMGTLAALIACFWRDWWSLAKDGLRRADTESRRLFDAMVVGTLPAGVAGLILEHRIETVFRDPARIAVALAAFGVLLWWADRTGRKERGVGSASLKDVLLIGLAQTLALVPGVSRSGITMTAGLGLGFDRVSAARLSFLLAMPITAAAGLHKAKDALPLLGEPAFWAGIAASGLVGIAAIRGLLKLLGERGMGSFAVYRVGLAAVILLLLGR